MASLALAFDILAKDKGASKTLKDVGRTAETTGKQGESAGKKLGTGMKVGLLAAAAGAVTLTVSLGKFIGEAKESQRIGRLTEAVVKSTGGVANVSAGQVDKLATALSNKTAVDDELIQSGANVLLTFTKVRNEAGKGNDIFNQGATAALNLSAALGTDLQAANIQVGKALNDPIKGITSLTRAGVQFTDQQKEQIKALVEAGDTLGAQKIILGELETQFGGAAEAAASPLDRLKVVAGNLGEEIGGYLLPTVERFATYASETLAPAIQQVLDILFKGDFTGDGPFSEDSKVVDVLFKMRDGFLVVRDAAVLAFNFFREEILPRLEQFAAFMRDEVIPRVKELADRFEQDVLPRLRDVAGYLKETFQPTFDELVELFNENVKPALNDVRDAIEENRPALEKVATAVATVTGVMLFLQTQIAGKVLPILVELVGYLIDHVVRQFELTLDAISLVVDVAEDLRDAFRDAKNKVRDFIEELRDFETPQWIKDLDALVERVGDGLQGAGGNVADFFGVGDAPGGFRGTILGGGPALARVQSVLPAGLAISSTYRSPAHNARVGGSPTSLHMDRDNPAVDIAGPVGLLDAFAAQLAAMGGWRQLLWRTEGHFDHIHVAHSGGMVSSSWPRMPGDRPDERTARLQVGERVQSRSEVAASGRGDVFNLYGVDTSGEARRIMRAALHERDVHDSLLLAAT